MVGRGVVNSMKVIVVDDDEFLMIELAEFFERKGCSVSTGQNGVEAVELVRSEQPDLLIMDVQMPRMDGLEAVAELKRSGLMVPMIVLMSGDRHGLNRARGFANVIVLEKPLNLDSLRALIGR